MATTSLSPEESKSLVNLKRLTTKESTTTSNAYTSYTTATVVASANANQSGVSIYNDTDTDNLYVLVGDGTVSSSLYTSRVLQNELYETPYHFSGNVSIIQSGATTGRICVSIFT